MPLSGAAPSQKYPSLVAYITNMIAMLAWTLTMFVTYSAYWHTEIMRYLVLMCCGILLHLSLMAGERLIQIWRYLGMEAVQHCLDGFWLLE